MRTFPSGPCDDPMIARAHSTASWREHRHMRTTEIGRLAELLHETAEHHDAFEKSTPPHDWWDWYAGYLDARQQGLDSEEATRVADQYMADVRHIVRQ